MARQECEYNETITSVSATTTFHNNITSYTASCIVDGWYHISGLIVVNSNIAQNSTIATVAKATKHGHNFALINVGTGSNHMLGMSSKNCINTQTALTTGTYLIDTWFYVGN